MPLDTITHDLPATKKQLKYIKDLSGEDVSSSKLTIRQAAQRIEKLKLLQIEAEISEQQATLGEDSFSEAKVQIVEGDQRSGKSIYCVGKIIEAYFKDCVRIFCENILKIECEVKAYYRKDRVAKIKHEGKIEYIHIPENYELKSPMRIFSNIHLCGVPFVYIPSFRHMLAWLHNGFISNGFLLIDESHKGMSNRATQTEEGRQWVGEIYQFGKSKLDVFLVTHHARMIDVVARLIPTKRISCEYDPKTRRVTYTIKRKGIQGEETHSFDASQYFGNYYTNEKVNA